MFKNIEKRELFVGIFIQNNITFAENITKGHYIFVVYPNLLKSMHMKLHYDFTKSLALVSLALSSVCGGTLSVQASNLSFSAASAAFVAGGEMAGAGLLSVGRTYGIDGTPVIELDNRSFMKARGKVGQKIEVGKVHVKATDLPAEMQIVASRTVEGIFTTDVTKLPAGNSEVDITVYYEAKKIGKDEGKLYFMLGEDIYEQINMSGLAIDPATPPAVVLEPAELAEFSTEVGKPVVAEVIANLVGLPSAVMVKVNQAEPGFSVSSGYLYQGVPKHNLKVTFNPKTAGTFEATIVFENEFFEPLELKVKGTATAKPDEKPETEGDQLPLPTDNPMKLMKEGFDKGVHNKPLKLEGWTNLAGMGTRAWWGYQFPDYDKENAGEFVAKATTYDSKVEPGTEEECQMVLLTPPLDFKNAESKMFTFRVMGKGMTEGMPDKLMFCHFYEEDGFLNGMPVEGVAMPSRPDENGEWIDYHVDLSNSDLDDVFYMGFLLDGYRGTLSAASYYIDDVSFGRVDLPLMSPDKGEVNLTVAPNVSAVSESVSVSAKNLTEPIKLSLGGRDKASFELSSKTLPTEGGEFTVKFKGEETGNYEAYVKLSSRGAATKFVAFFASTATGIQSLVTEQADRVVVMDMDGRILCSVDGASVSEALSSLPSGIYVIRATGALGTRTIKMKK